jgi:branched-chain amino acid transport system substrate-binding protein
MTSKRSWRLWLPLALLVLLGLALTSVSLASSGAAATTIRVAIMTDCKGAFAFGYEPDIGGAQAALAKWAGGKAKSAKKPSAGMSGIKVAGHPVQIVGYGCGDDTPATGLKETRRLMEQLKADIMLGPLSGDEAVAIANYAKSHTTKTFIVGTAGSQDPTLQIAPKNMFRYFGDGAQWNAGLGEIVYKKLGWRKAAIIMDDYSFGWTSGAGIIADFCSVGGQITKRVFAPLNTADYSASVRQLPAPGAVDGYFWVIGGTGTGAALKAYEQAYGPLSAKKHAGNLFFAFLGNFQEVAPRLVGAYVGGFGTGPGLKTAAAKAYEASVAKTYPGLNGGNYADGFVYNYYNAAQAMVLGLTASKGAVGAALQKAMPKSLKEGYEVTDGGRVILDSNRQGIQDQYPLQIGKGADGKPNLSVVGFVPNVNQGFGNLFTKSSPPPGRTQPACKKVSTPWQGKIQVVKNGTITKATIK